MTHFSGLLDLARLPYFDVRDGRLVLADPSLGPAIDVHTHLALSFGNRGNVDLRAAPRPAEHFLSAERALDFDVYQNRNFTPVDLTLMRRELSLHALCPVNCGGRRVTHTLPNLTREMNELGITRSVLLPIDMPLISRNADAWLEAAKGNTQVLCFGSVHPFDPFRRRKLDAQITAGIRGLKVHPAVQLVPPDHDRCMSLYRLCGERHLPVLFHCGPTDIETERGRRCSQVALYERAVAECPETRFVLGHAGALQLEEGLGLAERYPNVYLEIASQSLPGVRRILERAAPERVMYGSDWPFYHQAIGLAKVFLATEGAPSLRRSILSENACRLFGL